MRRFGLFDARKTAGRLAPIVVLGLLLACGPRTASAVCGGDCDGDAQVTVDEIVKAVNIALGTAAMNTCTAADTNNDGGVTVEEIVGAVNRALSGCPLDAAICGNGVIETGEECDNGGLCFGGSNAGTACTKESDCQGNGRCSGGVKEFGECATDADCNPNGATGGKCLHCMPVSSDSPTADCAANCTKEQTVNLKLKPGEIEGTGIKSGSGAVATGDFLVVPLSLSGDIKFTIGKKRNGKISAVIKAGDATIPRIPVQTLACACLRTLEAKTCGAVLTNLDGTDGKDCTSDASVCPATMKCAPLHGTGNSASGTIGCEGLAPLDLEVTQNSRGSDDPEECTDPDVRPPTEVCADPLVITRTGSGGPGSMSMALTGAIVTVVGECTGTKPDYGTDGQFCTDDDPESSRGTPSPQLLTSGKATGLVEGANQVDAPDGNIGPITVEGTPLSCSDVEASPPKVTPGLTLGAAFTSINQPTLGDIVISVQFQAEAVP